MVEHHLPGVDKIFADIAADMRRLTHRVERMQRQVEMAVDLYEGGDEEGCNRVLAAAGEGRIVEGCPGEVC